MTTKINGVLVTAPDDMDYEEQLAYVKYVLDKHPHDTFLEIRVEGDEVLLNSHAAKVPFERIRRITGYLVGTMDKWNNGKRAEEHDRVKHAVD